MSLFDQLDKHDWTVIALGIVVLVGVVAGGFNWNISGPPAWLVGWTGWAASALAILLTPNLLIATVLHIRARTERLRSPR